MKLSRDESFTGIVFNAGFQFKAVLQFRCDGQTVFEDYIEGPTSGEFGAASKPNVVLFRKPIHARAGQDVTVEFKLVETVTIREGYDHIDVLARRVRRNGVTKRNRAVRAGAR